MFLENDLTYIHLDFQIYGQNVEQAIPHIVHHNESQWHMPRATL